MKAILDSNLSDEKKQIAEAAVKELGETAKVKDTTGFLDALVKTTSIAKNVSSLGGVIIPIVGELISKYFTSM